MPRDVIEIRGLNELIARLDDVSQNVFERRLMAEIGEYIIFRIEKHTAQGKDVEGRNFEPYSPRYKLFRRKTGHPVDKVNLFYSGSMMSSMTRTETDNESKVFFMPTTDRSGASNPLKAYALNKDRRFFAIGVVEQQKIIDMVREHAEQLLLGEG